MLTSVPRVYSEFTNILTGILPPTLPLNTHTHTHTHTDMHHFISTLQCYFLCKGSPDFFFFFFWYLWLPVTLCNSFTIFYHNVPSVSYLYLFSFSTTLRVAWICQWYLPLFCNHDFLAYDMAPGRWSVKVCRIELRLLRTVSL